MALMLRSVILLLMIACPVLGQWSTGGTTGGKNRVSSGFDSTQFDAAVVVELPAAKTKIRMIDTTVTSTSVSRIVAFNLNDPNQLGRYNAEGELVSAFDQFRTAELNGSIWRSEGLLHPAQGFGIITNGQDTLSIWNGLTMAKILAYNPGANNALQDATPVATDLVFQDGVWWVTGTGGADVTAIDHWADAARKWDTGGDQRYNARLTSRNAASGWTVLNTVPATTSATDYALAVIRSPFSGLAGIDRLGRQRPYLVVGTSDAGEAASYNSSGTLSIYNIVSTADWQSVRAAGTGFIGTLDDGTKDYIIWQKSILPVSADDWNNYVNWNNGGSQAEDIRWPNATIITGVATLDGASVSGRNSYRFFAASDTGLYILDSKANDNTNGCKREITSKYVSPAMCGNALIAWSGGSSANVLDRTKPFTTDLSPTFTVDGGTPTGAYMTIDANDEGVRRVHATDYLLGTGDWTVSWTMLVNSEITSNKTVLDLYAGDDSDHLQVYVQASGDEIICRLTDDAFVSEDALSLLSATDDAVWRRFDWTRSGSSMLVYINGVVSGSGTVINATAALDVTTISIRSSGTPAVTNSMTNFVLTKTALSAETIASLYADDLRYVNSPTPDTLYSASQHRVKVNPISGQFLLMDTTRTTSVVEIHDKSGALIDTLVCTNCGRGRDADFIRIPGLDSTAMVFGGKLGYRVVAPDPRVSDLALASWPTWSANYIGNGPAVVDSTGHGDFWTLNDAVAAMNNVGQNFVRVMLGTYPAATISQAGMVIEGAGDTLTVFDGLAAAAGLTVSGADVTIRNLGAKTTPGGGSAFDAFSLASARLRGSFLTAMGSDDDCFAITANQMILTGIRAHRCDDVGILLTPMDNGMVAGEVQNQSGASVSLSAASDRNIIGPIRTDGAITDTGVGNVIISEETAY